MRKKKKESVPISLRMDSAVFEMLEKHCSMSGQSKTSAIEHALRKYIKEYKQFMEESAE